MAELQRRVQKGDTMHYMDDILIGSQTFDEMYEKVERIQKDLKECGLTLNLDKCELYKQSITFLGHQIHAEGISPGEIKTNAIRMFPNPANVTEVRKFAGYAIISAPLRILIKPEVQPAIRRGALGTRTWTSAYGREAVDDIQEQLGNL